MCAPGMTALKKRSLVVFAWVALAASVLMLPACESPFRPSPKKIAEKITQSLVRIETFDVDGRPIATGSGFFFEDTGRVVTNLHVMERASDAVVKVLGQNVQYKVARVRAISLRHDLCALTIEGAAVPGLRKARRPPQVGEDVYAGGSPLGLEGTVSKGIVTALRPDQATIQIDVAISPGSSGGPVVNAYGEVVGVATSGVTKGQNLNFAVDAGAIRAMVEIDYKVVVAGILAFKDTTRLELRGPVRWARHTVAWPLEKKRWTETIEYWFNEQSQLTREKYSERWKNLSREGETLYEYDGEGFLTGLTSSGSQLFKGEQPQRRFSQLEGLVYLLKQGGSDLDNEFYERDEKGWEHSSEFIKLAYEASDEYGNWTRRRATNPWPSDWLRVDTREIEYYQ